MLFAGVPLSAADVSIPEIGNWSARVRLAEGAQLAKGTRGALVLGGLSLQGVVVDGGVPFGRADYQLVGGAGGWRSRVPHRPYRADNGVRLRDVAGDVAAEVGERVEVAPSAERVVGYAWTRAAGLASETLDLLRVPWFMRPDGVTAIGPRPGGRVLVPVTLASFDPSRRSAVLGLADEDLDSIAPGQILTADDGEEIYIEHVRIVVTPGRVFVEVGPHAERRLLDAVTERVLARMRYFGTWPYQVTEQLGARLSLTAEPLSEVFPGLVSIDVAHGHGGASEELPKGAVVLVAWRGGDPGSPYVAGIVSGTPTTSGLAASQRIDVNAPLVRVGDTGHKAVARVGDKARVDPALFGSPGVPGGGVMYNPGSQSLVVVPPGTAGAIFFEAPIVEGSAVLSTK